VSLNSLILVLRFAAAVLLYLFVLGIVVVIWRDWRSVARQVAHYKEVTNRSWGRLVIITSGETELVPGQTFPINVVTGFGRAMSNTVVINDSFASLEHARLSQRTGRWWLEDLGSTNGTRLNGEPLTSPAIVTTGDEVGIGQVRLRIELESL